MDPEIDSAAKSKVGVAVLVLIVVALGFYLIWRYSQKGGEEKTSAPTLGEQVSGQVQTPTESVPNVNPYEAETNPFEKANPLKNIYKNPFGQ
ncbi:MAG: hypothetical protein WAP55_02880 [Minisyncoccia bacterium]